MDVSSDPKRTQSIYQDLRERLVDRTRRNRLLHFRHTTSGAMIRIVDRLPDLVLARLQNEGKLRFKPLPDSHDEPPEERTSQFQSILSAARVTDEDYRVAIAALDQEDISAIAREERIERELRDRIRGKLGLPRRPERRSLDVAAYARENGIDPSYDLPLESDPIDVKYHDDWLQTLMFPDKLKVRVGKLARKADEVERETGVATLHLAFGFLEWFESDDSDSAFSSPLLLLPVGLERHREKGGEDQYRLIALDDAPITNLSLELRLRDDFRINLPAFDYAKDPVETYLRDVVFATRSLKRSRVRRYMTLAQFSFARIAMYRDLDQANWAVIPGGPAAHPLVLPIIRGQAETASGDERSPGEYDIDEPEIEKLAPILVSDADSSQHSAIIDVMKGRNLVIEGPPGTGKSQTIANLIANVLHRGGRVLFVSEKMAALEAVKSRLERAGLGHFCLPLHAAGAKPSAVIDALRQREGVMPPTINAAAASVQDQTVRSRSEIKSHLEALHEHVGPLGETVHVHIGRFTELTRVLPWLPALLRDRAGDLPATLNHADIAEAKDRLEILEKTSRAISESGVDPAASPFRLLERIDLFQDEREALLQGLERLVAASEHLQLAGDTLRMFLGRSQAKISVTSVLQIVAEIETFTDPPDATDRVFLATLTTTKVIEDAIWRIRQVDALVAAYDELKSTNVDNPALLNVDAVHTAINLAGKHGVTGLTIDQVLAGAARANEQAKTWAAYSKIIKTMTQLLGLGDNPTVGLVRLACAAARLATGVDPSWHSHCRPGLERHIAVLEAGASRQVELAIRMKEVLARIDLEGLSYSACRAAGNTLRDAGLFSLLRPDVREAKRLFSHRWRGGPRPKTNLWADELYAASRVLAELNALANDTALRAAIGGQLDPWKAPLRQFARAAKWQGDVVSALSGADPENKTLSAAIIALDAEQVCNLASLAVTAEALLEMLEQMSPPDVAVWSDLQHAVVSRAADFATLAECLSASRLRGSLPMFELGSVAAAHARWSTAAKALASDQAQAITVATANDGLRSAVAFAQDVSSCYKDLGLFLLADGWTNRITVLRQYADDAKSAAQIVSEILDGLSKAGLRSLAGSARDRAIDLRDRDIDVVRRRASEMLEVSDQLPAYLDFAAAREPCQQHVIACTILAAFEKGPRSLSHLPEALDWLVSWTIVRRHAEAKRHIFNRLGNQLSKYRQHFAAADRSRLVNDAKLVQKALLSRPIPAGSASGSRKEWTDNALLQNEFTKIKRHIPVRDLLGRASNAVLSLTPCMMMSPLTVAQYLKPGGATFDVVIMDEASQIKPEDALGAMLRGRQAVIVGDRKQLPPSNFFDRALDELDEDFGNGGEENDSHLSAEDRVMAESVLDLAARAFRPARRLRWHYRSQHESLIAFSNREFYRNDLVVFPSSHAPSETLGIEFVRIRGFWRERINQEEAKAIASAAADFMRRHQEFSLGIISMNQPQRELIQAEIDSVVAGDTALQNYRDYWEERVEPPFVKNLENVQGDERDVIFISLGWGRTVAGSLQKNFFPINRKDGDRRLNVLFTRAKRKIVLFSSIDPEDILVYPEKTPPGVRILRDYLAYARDGRIERGLSGEGEADSPFEMSVANALRALGHDVALQVGVAGYRIDIAVRHPAESGRFVLGIECDGASYHSAKSARDRDRLRQEALERLGWKLARVWSTDWFRDPVFQAKRLSDSIDAAIEEANRYERGRPRLVEQQDVGLTFVERVEEVASQLDEAKKSDAKDTTSAKPKSLAEKLRDFRENVIMRDFPGSEAGRCILRDAMIEAIIRCRLDDPSEFLIKIPEHLRSRTDGRQVVYLDQISEIVMES